MTGTLLLVERVGMFALTFRRMMPDVQALEFVAAGVYHYLGLQAPCLSKRIGAELHVSFLIRQWICEGCFFHDY
jgi:hypothetical protein